MLKARQGKELVLRVADKIGALAEFSKIVAERGVSILAMSAWVEDAEAVIRLVTDDTLRTLDVLRAHGYEPQERDVVLVDAVTTRMVLRPASLDVIVATNLHADILSDLAAALSGSLGIAPTANLNPERAFPSMFEPIHGSAFDITGMGIANPTATFWTAAMMLEHLGEEAAAARLMAAVEKVTASGLHTPDLGGKATTAEVTRAVCAAVA